MSEPNVPKKVREQIKEISRNGNWNAPHLYQNVFKTSGKQTFSKQNIETPVQTGHNEKKWTHYSIFSLGLWKIPDTKG